MSRRKNSCQPSEEPAFRPKKLPPQNWRTLEGQRHRVVTMMPAAMYQHIHRHADRQCKAVSAFMVELAYRFLEDQERLAARTGGDEGLANILRRP